jgi:hypothetical protein
LKDLNLNSNFFTGKNPLMRTETLQAGLQADQYEISSDTTISDFDLPSLIETMKHSFSWTNGELSSMVLQKNPGEQIILAVMPDGTEIESFQSNDSVTLKILEGKLRFHVLKNSITIRKDQLMTLKQHIGYRLTTSEETIFLLTISSGSSGLVSN